ncbi:MAG: anti-sigma factor family protein [Egibacteraceae bacterium]
MSADHDPLLRSLGEALRPDEVEPPPERIAELRGWVLADRARRHDAPIPAKRRWPLAVAAALLSALATAAALTLSRPPAVPVEEVALSQVPPGVEAEAQLIAHTWGTEVQLVVSGLADGQAYTVYVDSDQGDHIPAGTFLGTGAAPLRCNLNSAVLRGDAVAFEVLDGDGDVVMRSNLA